MTSTETAWLAGFLEGEGCFMVRHNSRSPRIIVASTDRDVLERVAKLSGFHVMHSPMRRIPNVKTQKPLFRLDMTGPRAIQIMEDILPWMGQRRAAKIAEILTKYREMKIWQRENVRRAGIIHSERARQRRAAKCLAHQ